MFRLSTNDEYFAVLGPKGRILYCNSGFSSLVAGDGASIVGTNIEKWLKPLGVRDLKYWYCLPIQGGVLIRAQREGWLHYRLESMEGGSVLFVRQDQTAMTIQIEELYSRAFPLNPGLSAISVLETGEHLDVNRAWLRAMGYRRSEVIGKTARELHIWEKGDESRRRIVEELTEKGRIENFRAKMRTKDNQLLDIMICAEVVDYMDRRLVFFASHDVTRRERAENELILKNKYLKQANLALRSMLDNRDAEKRAIEETIFLNIKQYILPYFEEIERQNLNDETRIATNLIRDSINQLMSSAPVTLFSVYADFTPMEVKVADLVKQGLRTKEIGEYLKIAPGSVSTYRNSIRKKLNICNSKTNLQIYLKSLQNRF